MDNATKQLHVFGNDCEWIVAADLEDARQVLCEMYGADVSLDDYQFEQEPDEATMGIWCDEHDEPSEIGGDGCTLISRTNAEWAALRGRSYLCTTET